MNFQSTEYKQATTSTWERASRYCPSSVFSFHTHAWDRLMKQSAAAKSLQSCPTLCDSIDGSPPGSPIPGILQARTLEWVAISFSNAWKWKVKVKSLSCVRLLATPWSADYQAPPPIGFSRQEYWTIWKSNVFPFLNSATALPSSYFSFSKTPEPIRLTSKRASGIRIVFFKLN